MTTREAIIADAFEALALAGYVFDLDDSERATAYRKLDQMMASWAQDGINLGYKPSGGKAKAGELIDTPAYADEAIYSNLALRLAGVFGKEPSGNLKRQARLALARLGSGKIPTLKSRVPIRTAGDRRRYLVGEAVPVAVVEPEATEPVWSAEQW